MRKTGQVNREREGGQVGTLLLSYSYLLPGRAGCQGWAELAVPALSSSPADFPATAWTLALTLALAQLQVTQTLLGHRIGFTQVLALPSLQNSEQTNEVFHQSFRCLMSF